MMEKITTDNYEAWFLDYIEGNLTKSQTEVLYAFLKEHPELADELDVDLKNFSLKGEAEIFEAKNQLLTDESGLVLNLSTVDEVMIAHAEGLLKEDQINKLSAFAESENLSQVHKAYLATRLKADLTEVFSSKESLKMKTPVIPLYYRIAGVAAAAVLAFAFFWNRDTDLSIAGHNPSDIKHEQVNRFATNVTTEKLNRPDLGFAFQVESVQSDVKKEVVYPEQELVVVEENQVDSSTSIVPILQNDLPDLDQDITHQMDTTSSHSTLDQDEITQIDVTDPIRREEPLKLFTDAAGNVINRDISFTRDKNIREDEYVAYSFKLGSFEFERKKSK